MLDYFSSTLLSTSIFHGRDSTPLYHPMQGLASISPVGGTIWVASKAMDRTYRR